jgi:rod shape-determining protein MreC
MNSEASRLKFILNLIVVAISIYGISQKNFEAKKSTYFEKLVIETLTPIKGFVTLSKRGFSGLVDEYLLIVDAKKENQELTEKINWLSQKIDELGEIQRENLRLRTLLEFGEGNISTKKLAQVIGRDSTSDHKVLRINKGSKDGIREKLPVINSKGLVGYIIRTTKNYSDVLSILDQNNRVDAVVARTRSHGIIEGYSDDRLSMKYVNRTEPLVLDDTVFTSGLSEIYPKGLLIGKVTLIERESFGTTQLVQVTPMVDFSKLEEVIVLLEDPNLTLN